MVSHGIPIRMTLFRWPMAIALWPPITIGFHLPQSKCQSAQMSLFSFYKTSPFSPFGTSPFLFSVLGSFSSSQFHQKICSFSPFVTSPFFVFALGSAFVLHCQPTEDLSLIIATLYSKPFEFLV